MEEEVIIVGQEDNVIKIEEDASSGIEIKEYVESVTVDAEKPISVGAENAFPPLGEDNADLNHSKLYGRDLPNQHPIYAVEGLREELDAIESLQTVYSDKKQQANYYMWQDENLTQESRDGYFVCFYQGTDKIQKCNGKSDVFGVTVADAGFVGGQEYIQAPDGKKAGRDSAYGLVVTAGTVSARCESDVVVGDYVVPNVDGIAEKSSGKYGYLVIAIEDKNGIDYAIISLTSSSTLAQSLANNVQNLGDRMSSAERNITAVGNTANAAYKLAKDTKESTSIDMDVLEEKVKEIIERTDNNENQADRIEIDLGSLKQSVAQAKAQAQSAINSAEAIRKEAVKTANDALTEAKKNSADLEAYQSVVANIDKYTVGEHSQAYGLTLAQAEQVLERGMIYVPTVGWDEEGYKNIEEYSSVYSQSFLKGYYYTWSGISWIPSTAVGVAFSSDGIYITGSENMPYWVVENEDVVHEGITYPKDALYLWQNDKWNQQATISKNVINRTVALVRHTANEVAQEVINARGSAATLGARLDEDGAKVSLVASVVTELKDVEPANKDSITDKLPETGESGAYYCVGTSAPYDVYKYDGTEFKKELLIYYDGAHFCKVNTASIVGAVNNDGDSSISLSANKINFSGLSTFFSTDEDGGITAINGNGITTGAIQSINYKEDVSGSKISLEDGTIDSKHFKVSSTGEITATSGNIGGCTIDEANGLKVDAGHITSIDASKITTGTMQAGVIQSKNYVSGTSGLKLNLNSGEADITGKIVAKEGKIGELTINIDGSINSNNNYFTVGADGKITATNADIKGVINANSGKFGNCTISTDGVITSANGNFKVSAEGNFTAIGGSVGGFNINSSALYSGVTNMDISDGTQGVYVGTDGINLGGGNFKVDSSGMMNIQSDGCNLYTNQGGLFCNDDSDNSQFALMPDFFFLHYGTYPENASLSISSITYAEQLYYHIDTKSTGLILGANSKGSLYVSDIGGQHLGTWSTSSSVVDLSDKNAKNSIESLSENYELLFDALKPVKYKYNDGTSNRYHTGFIAQDVLEAINQSGLTTQDFAAYVEFQNNNFGGECGIRYEELIALCVNEIQKLKKEIKALKGEE